MVDKKISGDVLEPGEASSTVVSLSQVLLAPLDAIFKAQVHAGRSFLNFLLQLSYEHKPGLSEATGGSAVSTSLTAPAAPSPPRQPDKIYSVDFVQEVPAPSIDGKLGGGTRLQKVSVPALALVPLQPLSIQEAQLDLAMEVTWIGAHRQIRQSERDNPDMPVSPESGEDMPWYLVDDPISLRGHVAASSDKTQGDKPLIHVSLKLGVVPTPAGLDRLLTTLTQSANVTNTGTDNNPPTGS